MGTSNAHAVAVRLASGWHHRRMTATFAPPWTAPAELPDALREHGHAVLSPASVSQLLHTDLDQLTAWSAFWNDLPPDAHLRDGGRYRRRRHASFVVEGETTRLAPHRAHWQPVEYNALHGGLERWFEPMVPQMIKQTAWQRMLATLAGVCSAVKGVQPWYVEAHPFRIDTTDGIGRPTPEGAHRDGVDFVVVVLVAREGVKGGETRVFEAQGPRGIRFTMTEPWTLLMLDDARVVHESTPIQPLPGVAAGQGHRDTLVLTFRSGGFLGPERA
jgi:hypothetical protein